MSLASLIKKNFGKQIPINHLIFFFFGLSENKKQNGNNIFFIKKKTHLNVQCGI